MNVLALLDGELKGKNWTLSEKIRYLYLRSCQIFSYDEKYDFYYLLSDGDDWKQKLRERTFNLEEVEDNSIVCTPHAWYVFSTLVEELLQVPCIRSGIQSHGWCVVDDGIRKIEADAAISSDLARVKMQLTTNRYKPVKEERNTNAYFYREIKEADRKIGYIEYEYFNAYLMQQQQHLKRIIDLFPGTVDEKFLYRMDFIKQLFQANYCFQHYSDASYCIHYLQLKLLENKELEKIWEVPLFQDYDYKPWEFMTIYLAELKNDRRYFMLDKKPGRVGYTFSEVEKTDAFCYIKTMKGEASRKERVFY